MGIRTPDLLIANETLYQLSYTPRDCAREYAIMKSSGKPKRAAVRVMAGCQSDDAGVRFVLALDYAPERADIRIPQPDSIE